MAADIHAAVVELVRRHGRRGLNEATVWTLLRGDLPGVTTAEASAAVEQLIAEGRLYRDRRKTRTMLHVAAAQPTPPAPGLFDGDGS